MDKVTKVYFDPLAVTKERICSLLKGLPVGSAHPFRPEGILLVHLGLDTILEVDISKYDAEYFSNTIDLAGLGESSLERMRKFRQLDSFTHGYMIQQTPASTFKVPLVDNEITIFALSERVPTFYDLCIADSGHNTSCYNAYWTFPGLAHSGDITAGTLLLHHIKIDSSNLEEKEYVIVVSGYEKTKLTEFKEMNPLVIIANHEEKVLYVVPVPLDQASIGKAILCCPMVIKTDKSNKTLACSVLQTPTTDDNLICNGSTLNSGSFAAAVSRADFSMTEPDSFDVNLPPESPGLTLSTTTALKSQLSSTESNLILASTGVTLPDFVLLENTQLVRFGTGVFWMNESDNAPLLDKSTAVLPCVLGDVLSGPLILATADVPENLHLESAAHLHQYYENAKSVTVVVGEEMTDNSRNLATPWRINALFIIQSKEQNASTDSARLSLLENVNINAITALAGPQSLILVQVGSRYYYYRGIANKTQFDYANLEFGEDVTETLQRADLSALIEAQWPRLVKLAAENNVFLLESKQQMDPDELAKTFERLPFAEISELEGDIISLLPQLQTLLSQQELEKLSSSLLLTLQSRLMEDTREKRRDYIRFLTQEYTPGANESKKKKDQILADLRQAVKHAEACLGWLTKRLGNIISSQQTSTRSHDLKRMLRKSAIKSNVGHSKSMTFEKMAELLEQHANEMGVLLINLDTEAYHQLLRNSDSQYNMSANLLELDPRILHLDGLDAGIIIHQSQDEHLGPLASRRGPHQPILALPYIGQRQGSGSMLAWVCWDEFVNLEDPSTVRWVEKCNETHIATLRILMRKTTSNAMCSRELNMSSSSPATGQLVSFLLVTSMHHLAMMRTTAPTENAQATDTITKLMRGLFGHLLILAGSGSQPMSMVWQMMGKKPRPEVPHNPTEWSWYENVASLYPYTGWPAHILNKNLELLLDKIIFRLVIQNMSKEGSNQLRAYKLTQGRTFRNSQLSNLRTLIIGLMEVLSIESGRDKMATNLLRILPMPIEDKKPSYARLYSYVEHLAKGGACHAHFSTSAANIYTRRSGFLKDSKKELAAAVKRDDWDRIQAACREILQKRKWVAQRFGIQEDAVKVQGLVNIQNLLESCPTTVKEKKDMYMRASGDTELRREDWQIGNGEYGSLSSLDIDSLLQILHGADPATIQTSPFVFSTVVSAPPSSGPTLDQIDLLVEPPFLERLKTMPNAPEVCDMLQIPISMMHVFISALAPQFEFECLQQTFGDTIYALLLNPDQRTMKPTRKLFGNLLLQ